MCEKNRLFWIVREKNAKWNQGIEPPGRVEVWVRMIADATNSVDTWRLDDDLSTRADWSRTTVATYATCAFSRSVSSAP